MVGGGGWGGWDQVYHSALAQAEQHLILIIILLFDVMSYLFLMQSPLCRKWICIQNFLFYGFFVFQAYIWDEYKLLQDHLYCSAYFYSIQYFPSLSGALPCLVMFGASRTVQSFHHPHLLLCNQLRLNSEGGRKLYLPVFISKNILVKGTYLFLKQLSVGNIRWKYFKQTISKY